MSLLKLSNIGKIYVSGETVAVGIRGVNLEFDIGEFVAVTGKSGSGKTTLLNIISGMDTYEEGELYIEGETTSHFDQSDWEEFRQKYISFIFQDYNIIESFTVLQNVELALADDYVPKERRRRALELIDRVGLTDFKNHKGSKLSGGQKQRTVIARALAKDSPIILADEPTGNLDSQTSKEIIELLAEISHEKLVIVVTHNFDEVADFATREIRIFDGAIERDEPIKAAPIQEYVPGKSNENAKRGNLRKGLELGFFRFFAMPRLSAFTCIIMVIAMLGSFVATSVLFQGSKLFDKNYVMTHIDGRVAVSPQDGSEVNEDKIKELADKVGASSYVVHDRLFEYMITYNEYRDDKMYATNLAFVVDDDLQPSVGRRPEAKNEVMLYLPIGMQPIFGKDEILIPQLNIFDGSCILYVVGLKYYYDNNRPCSDIVLTSEGFSELTKYVYVFSDAAINGDSDFKLVGENGVGVKYRFMDKYLVAVDPSLSGREIYFANTDDISLYATTEKILLDDAIKQGMIRNFALPFNINSTSLDYYDDYYDYGFESDKYQPPLIGVEDYKLNNENTVLLSEKRSYSGNPGFTLCISPEIAHEISASLMKDYSQASLFFENDKAANKKIIEIRQNGYNAVASSWTATNAFDRLWSIIITTGALLLWLAILTFVSFFLSICTSRAIIAKMGDVAILRSMGVKVKVIKLAQYVQMAMAAVPAIIVLIVTALVVFLTPELNPMLTYLYFYEYVLIVLGVLFVGFRMTRRNNKKMFSGSVRKTLKRDAADEA